MAGDLNGFEDADGNGEGRSDERELLTGRHGPINGGGSGEPHIQADQAFTDTPEEELDREFRDAEELGREI